MPDPITKQTFKPLQCIHRANCPTCHEVVTRFSRAVRILIPMVSTTTLKEADDLQAVEDLLLPLFGERMWEQMPDA